MECKALLLDYWAWCECPCHTGERRDPLGAFLADLAITTPEGIVPAPVTDIDYKDLR
jgi:hypothetical protein